MVETRTNKICEKCNWITCECKELEACAKCEGPIDMPYETSDGEYICQSCYTSYYNEDEYDERERKAAADIDEDHSLGA